MLLYIGDDTKNLGCDNHTFGSYIQNYALTIFCLFAKQPVISGFFSNVLMINSLI